LKREFERDYEGIIDEREDVTLRENMCDFAGALCDVRLANRFERVYPLRVFLSNLHHFSEAPSSDNFEQFKGVDRERLVSRWLEVYFEVE